ncbi:hypothetical protein Pla123a_36190 [Posidoniimonas polymericola]|uniref:PsbP C-terminal domain-containing protein n=1 Tax=Posidoniimonas polymericola TaxID=2528002 RepID=A0A5C5YDD3_9BACT|nr:hypothetical protein [Posidoniimonas polymericola]TWT73726.1 hypothetical protein Pla123a_36190 [Posidoniimonas polymericola]
MTYRSLLTAALMLSPAAAVAQEAAVADAPAAQEPTIVELADGDLTMAAPASWKKAPPRNRIIEQEFAVAIKELDVPARFTVMASGGSIEQNVSRWVGQFSRLDEPKNGGPKEGKPGELHELDANGMKAHWVDLSGDYMDSPRGPFGPQEERKDYRVLAAIVETKDSGNYFFKLVGPEQVVAKHKEAYLEMLKSVKAK